VKKQIFAIITIIILITVTFTGCLDEPTNKSEGNIIYVDSLGDKDFINIQEAIDSAIDGDTIDIASGDYYGTININKSIKITGHQDTILHPRNASENKNSIILISADNCTIEGLTIINIEYFKDLIGIYMNSTGNKITGNKISKVKYGIYLKDEVNNGKTYTNIDISNNEISNCSYGIYLYANTEESKINENEIIDNIDGITVYYFINSSIKNNIVHSNSQYGIYLNRNSDGNIVTKNVCSDGRYGIRFKSASDNEIFLNRLEKNVIGLYSCCGSGSNTLYKNTLINNDNHSSDGFYNSWDNGEFGNYWDDYTEKYPDAKKVGDHWNIPYEIPMGSNIDNFPLVEPII
jgi:nitrous oxidase accessory protein